jgi:hypothetical protein
MSDSNAVSHAAEDAGFRAADYNAIARQASLGMIRLAKVEFDCAPDFDQYEEDVKLSIHRECLGCSVGDEGDVVVAMFKFRAVGKHKRRNMLKGEAVYAVLYDIPGDSDQAAAQAFCQNVGQYAAYPYFRALMSQFAWAAEANIPPIPVIATDPKLSVRREPDAG